MDADFHGGWTQCDEIHSSDVQWNQAIAAAPRATVQPPVQAAAAPAPAAPEAPAAGSRPATARDQHHTSSVYPYDRPTSPINRASTWCGRRGACARRPPPTAAPRRRGQAYNQLSRFDGDAAIPPKSPGTGRRGAQPPGGITQIRFG